MSTPVFAPDHKGFRISAEGVLTRKTNSKADKFIRLELYGHLEILAKHYYAGNLHVVDEFLQLYCLGDEHRAAAKAKAEEAQP